MPIAYINFIFFIYGLLTVYANNEFDNEFVKYPNSRNIFGSNKKMSLEDIIKLKSNKNTDIYKMSKVSSPISIAENSAKLNKLNSFLEFNSGLF